MVLRWSLDVLRCLEALGTLGLKYGQPEAGGWCKHCWGMLSFFCRQIVDKVAPVSNWAQLGPGGWDSAVLHCHRRWICPLQGCSPQRMMHLFRASADYRWLLTIDGYNSDSAHRHSGLNRHHEISVEHGASPWEELHNVLSPDQPRAKQSCLAPHWHHTGTTKWNWRWLGTKIIRSLMIHDDSWWFHIG